MHYCPNCNNGMQEYNNYGSRTLNCRSCGQEIICGHKDPSRDQEQSKGQEEVRQEKEENKIVVSVIECPYCEGAWREKDLRVDSMTMYGIFFLCPNCGNRIFTRF